MKRRGGGRGNERAQGKLMGGRVCLSLWGWVQTERQWAGSVAIKWDLLMLILGQIATSKFMPVCRGLLNSQRWSTIMGCDNTYPKEWGYKWSLCHIAVSFLESCLFHKDTKQLGKHTRNVSTHEMLANTTVNQHFYLQHSIFCPIIDIIGLVEILNKEFWLWKQEHSDDQMHRFLPSDEWDFQLFLH